MAGQDMTSRFLILKKLKDRQRIRLFRIGLNNAQAIVFALNLLGCNLCRKKFLKGPRKEDSLLGADGWGKKNAGKLGQAYKMMTYNF